LSRQITDYATGKAVRDNPEEAYRQAFEHILVDDLGYPKSHIGIEVTIQRGANRSAEEADIVVFNDPRHTQDNAYIVVEIETPKKRYDYQALSYVTATTAPLSVWFAGFEKNSAGPYYHYRDLSNDATKFTEIPTLPRFGESFETIGQYRKSDLKPAKALRLLFKRIHHRLYGSGPIKREENVAKEIIKLIFCKILDELSPDDLCQFRATPAEVTTPDGQAVVKKRIQSLFDELLLDPDFGTMFVDEKLEYGPEWITYVVSELQGIGFLHDETNTDALGDAYEVFLPSSLKGESGQFFTPREVVRFAIQMIDPSLEKKEIILDPACGSGGFLSVAIEYLRKQAFELYAPRKFSKDRINQIVKDHAGKYIHGIDIDPLLYRIAKSYMAVVGDGKSNIYNFDSLLPFGEYNASFYRKIKPGSVDVITTNPPFGTKIDDTRKKVLQEFALGHRLLDGAPTKELLDGQDPDKLFLERDIQLLRPESDTKEGGRMVIVLPRQNLSGTESMSQELRNWLLKNVQITAVIDLPREAFQPHTGTKTSLVFIRRVRDPLLPYKVFMAVSEAVGHDRRGNPIYRKDDSGKTETDDKDNPVVWNDLPTILEQYRAYITGSEITTDKPSCFFIHSDQVRADSTHRLDAWYWDPNKNDLAKKLMDFSGESIQEIVNLGDLTVENGIFYPGRHKRNYVEPSGKSVPFYSGTQILQIRPFDLKHQPRDYKPVKQHIVEKDWILVTRSGSTGRVVIVNDELSGSAVSEHVIRVICDPDVVDPYYVYAYLASEKVGRVLMERGIYASVVDHITPQFVSTIPVPRLTLEKEKVIADSVRQAEQYRSQANRILTEKMSEVQEIVIQATGFGDMGLEVAED